MVYSPNSSLAFSEPFFEFLFGAHTNFVTGNQAVSVAFRDVSIGPINPRS